MYLGGFKSETQRWVLAYSNGISCEVHQELDSSFFTRIPLLGDIKFLGSVRG